MIIIFDAITVDLKKIDAYEIINIILKEGYKEVNDRIGLENTVDIFLRIYDLDPLYDSCEICILDTEAKTIEKRFYEVKIKEELVFKTIKGFKLSNIEKECK